MRLLILILIALCTGCATAQVNKVIVKAQPESDKYEISFEIGSSY
jgi:hypothetical protein